jgi:hypothetical protein
VTLLAVLSVAIQPHRVAVVFSFADSNFCRRL